MSDYSQRVTGSLNERMRLIRLRRKKENLRFWEEFRIIPRWLVVLVIFLYVVALTIATLVNLAASHNPYGNEMFPPELRRYPVVESLALVGSGGEGAGRVGRGKLIWVLFFLRIVRGRGPGGGHRRGRGRRCRA